MGAFFLYNKKRKFNVEAVLKTFQKKGFSEPEIINFNDHSLFLYNKILARSENHLENNGDHICATGTYIYKGLFGKPALQQLLADLKENVLDHKELLGNYTLIYYINRQLSILKDPENIYNIFHSTDGLLISSSFLALACSCDNELHLNKEAITEMLCTGYIIGSDTAFREILRFQKQNHAKFDGLNWYVNGQEIKSDTKTEYVAEISNQLKTLDSYFGKLHGISSFPCSIGVTGGFDSRLLLGYVNRHFTKPIYFSHFRKTKDNELSVAKKITNKLTVELFSPKVTEPNDMSETEFNDQLENSFYFLDGQIRASTFWTETYNTLSYFKNFDQRSYINFNGIGGEQYRNGERILFSKDITAWYYNETAYKFTGELFLSATKKKEFLDYLRMKVDKIMPELTSRRYQRGDIKRFLNEVFNPAGRCLRISTENQAYFALAPFTDYHVSKTSYAAAKHIGLSNRFEIDMIKSTIPELNDIKTSYGYSIKEGEPLKSKFLTIVKELLPEKTYYSLLQKRKKSDPKITNLYKTHRKLEAYFDLVKKLELPVDLNKLRNSAAHGPHIIALGYFLDRFSLNIRD